MRNAVTNIVGITSLVVAISAIIVPWLLFIQRPFTTTEPFPFELFCLYDNRIFYMLAGVGFVMGIVGFKSIYGKVGLIITAIALGFMMCFWIFMLLYVWHMETTGQSWF